MTEYESNVDIDNSIIGRKKEEFMNYYRDFDSNFKKKENTMTLYEESIKVILCFK